MDIIMLMAVLAIGTLALVAVAALVGKRRVEERRKSGAPKSTLAADQSSDGDPADV